ncbi:hypothetical protein [Treponema pedis]|uniref:DUF5723 domain-containing protein n=1 Tax=Treponema pedis str. T A4 TaxID=1291379 RepID=S5ZQQ7_9SPIR|nr:hypothetical protein [Treponema pedis]AGT44992.1 hypothetical protein TPE_2520 [Treponema pedis str. T A4]
MKKLFLTVTAVVCLSLYGFSQESVSSKEGETPEESGIPQEKDGLKNGEDIIDSQTENMLEEIRRRNGIDSIPLKKPDSGIKKDFFANGRTKFELGIDLAAGASNSYFSIKDFFTPEFEINFDKLSDSLPKAGFSTNVLAYLNTFLTIRIKDKYEFGTYVSAKGFSLINVPKNLIDFIVKGPPENGKIAGEITNMSSSFVDTSLFFGMKIKNFKFKVSGSYFVPLMYGEYSLVSYEFENNASTGRLYAKGKSNAVLYTDIPIFNKNSGKFNLQSVNSMLKNGGFDIGFDGSYKFNDIATLNFSLKHIPVVPARLNKGFSHISEGKIEIDSIIKYLYGLLSPMQNENINVKTPLVDFFSSGPVYDLPPKRILRPIKFNISSDIYPFKNKYLIITPSIGCHFLRPFYIDMGLRLESRFLKVLGLYYVFSREDKIWKNKLGFFFDSRIFRFEVAAAAVSPSFTGSFKAVGREVNVSVVVGY